MVDAERLRRILQRVTDDVAVLRTYAGAPGTVLGDPARLGHVKYLFVTAIEGCIDAAQHVCSSEGWGPPGSNADTMLVLARHDAIPKEVGERMREAVGFRNVLVHGYARVDDERVVATLRELGDIEAFVAALAGLAEG